MSNNDDKIIGDLITLGVILFIGAGIYKILEECGSLKKGEKVSGRTIKRVLNDRRTLDYGGHEAVPTREEKMALCEEAKASGMDVCWDCLTVKPDRCYCGNCMNCYGCAGGNECNTCSSDD